jgi:hypothetical protein
MACALRVREWKEQHRPVGTRLKYFHEDGDDTMPRFQELARGIEIHPIPLPAQDPETGEWFAPFQAADWLAWEVAREWSQIRLPKRRFPQRGTLSEMLKHLQPETSYYPKDKLVELVKMFPQWFPLREQ